MHFDSIKKFQGNKYIFFSNNYLPFQSEHLFNIIPSNNALYKTWFWRRRCIHEMYTTTWSTSILTRNSHNKKNKPESKQTLLLWWANDIPFFNFVLQIICWINKMLKYCVFLIIEFILQIHTYPLISSFWQKPTHRKDFQKKFSYLHS